MDGTIPKFGGLFGPHLRGLGHLLLVLMLGHQIHLASPELDLGQDGSGSLTAREVRRALRRSLRRALSQLGGFF